MGQPYKKQFLTISQQVRKLSNDGLAISDPGRAEAILARYGYYRLSGYWFIFREPDDPDHIVYRDINNKPKRLENRKSQFVKGATLEQVCKIYDFDAELRRKILEAIEAVEIALRFQIGHVVGRSDPYAHRDPAHLRPEFSGFDVTRPELRYSSWLGSDHAELTEAMDYEERRSSETFVDHFRLKYGGPLPIWAATEIMTFGTLTRLYAGLKNRDQNVIAGSMGVFTPTGNGDGALFNNWLNHLRYVRNICAHYGRVWNKNMTVQIADSTGIDDLDHLKGQNTTKRIYGTLALLAYLLARIEPCNTWKTETADFMKEAARIDGVTEASMGFPDQWERQDLWHENYAPDNADWGAKQQKLDALDCLTSQQAGVLLTPERSGRDRSNYLRYLRNKGQLLGLKLAGEYFYPKFQFSYDEVGLYAEAKQQNEELFESFRQNTCKDEIPWRIADWWLDFPDGAGLKNRRQTLLEDMSRDDKRPC